VVLVLLGTGGESYFVCLLAQKSCFTSEILRVSNAFHTSLLLQLFLIRFGFKTKLNTVGTDVKCIFLVAKIYA